MFKGKKDKLNPDTTDTLIGEGTTFEGNIKSEASIRIEGHLIGQIETMGDVIIGESASVRSNVIARNLVLAGQLTGDIEVKGLLTISTTGILLGNVTAQSFIIEAGGVFNGNSEMAVKQADTSPKKDDKAKASAAG